jgi:iron complex outermembrane receptor protein
MEKLRETGISQARKSSDNNLIVEVAVMPALRLASTYLPPHRMFFGASGSRISRRKLVTHTKSVLSPHSGAMVRWLALIALCSSASLAVTSWAAAGPRDPVSLAIESQPFDSALYAWARQTGYSVLLPYGDRAIEGLSPRVVGIFTAERALAALLDGSSLTYSFVNSQTVAVRAGSASDRDQPEPLDTAEKAAPRSDRFRVAQSTVVPEVTTEPDAPSTVAQRKREAESSGTLPEVLIAGSRILNVDLKRTADDPQPYVIFDRHLIENSGASNLEGFLRSQLPMNVASAASDQLNSNSGSGKINLRGLGTDETLILLDGRRMAALSFVGATAQQSLNGIPLAAIERIEVLPTTASGIFGGSATGGAINIVLRRDYSGVEGKLTYGSSFMGDALDRSVDLAGGWSLEGGKTSILVAASYLDSDPLLNGQRDYISRARDYIQRTNPAFFPSGAPPLGYTTNIRSNTLINGVRQNLVLDNGTSLNSTITSVPEGYLGVATDGGAALAGNAGRYNLQQENTAQRQGLGGGLLAGHETQSGMLTVRRELTQWMRAFADLRVTNSDMRMPYNSADFGTLSTNAITIPPNSPGNPFQQSITVSVPALGLDGNSILNRIRDRRAVAGFTIDLLKQWQLGADYTWDETTLTTRYPEVLSADAPAAIRAGTIDVLRDLNATSFAFQGGGTAAFAYGPAKFRLQNMAVRIAGVLPWIPPAGPLTLTVLAEHRSELLGDATQTNVTSPSILFFPHRSQATSSLYVETRLPVFSSRNARPGLRLLDVQLSSRYDRYNVDAASTVDMSTPGAMPAARVKNRSSSLDPTIAFRYQPLTDILMRASYGTGYRPPGMNDLVPLGPSTISGSQLVDPLRGNEPLGSETVYSGGNPDLHPETSETRSVGLILTPRWLPGVRISADWSQLRKKNNITGLIITGQSGLNAAINFFPERVIRAAPVPGDRFSVGAITALDDTLINVSRFKIETLDAAVDYQLDAGTLGVFDLTAKGTHLFTALSQLVPDAPLIENAGILATVDFRLGGLKWMGNSTVTWSKRGWMLGWRANFYDSYFLNATHTVVANQGSARVPSQIYYDLFGSYELDWSQSGQWRGALAGIEVLFGVNNVLDRKPPIDVTLSTFYSTLGDPRLANYYLSVKKSFGR